MPATYVSDITAATFQQDVVETSMTKPVLLDFWAAWCGPCRTLGPVLEKLAGEYHGGFVLGKVDSDKEQDLAYAFGVQGIPYCVLVDGGRPVDAFQGALPEVEIRRFLQRNGVEPVVLPPEPAVEKPPAVDPESPAGKLQRAIAAVAGGDAAAAKAVLAGFPEDDGRSDEVQRLLAGLAWLEMPLRADGPAAESALAAAKERLLAGDRTAAMDRILESVAADKTFQGGLARKAMLLCFVLAGEGDESLDPWRRRLATLLY
jgi:putative thioredoxin